VTFLYSHRQEPELQPSLSAASFTSKMDRCCSSRNRSSFSILCRFVSATRSRHAIAVMALIPCVNPHVLSLNLQRRFRCLGFKHEVVITVGTVLVTTPTLSLDVRIKDKARSRPFIKFLSILPEALLAFLARKSLMNVQI
jgi:hypothetical protein